MRRALIFIFLGSACFGQTSLTQYLGLTSAQQTAIQKLNADYLSYLNTENQQLSGIYGQLSTLYASSAPDPTALGKLYVQSEMARRDMASHLSALQTQTAAQLTGAQAGLIAQLGDSLVLQQLASDAGCAFLMQSSPSVLYGSLVGVVVALRTGNFADFLLGAPGLYVPPAPSGTFCGSTIFPISIREYMNVTNAQVAALAAASAAYNDYYAKQQDQLNDLSVNIRDETAKAAPDPAVLGFFYLQLAGVGKKIQDSQTALRQQALDLLTSAQKTSLKKLQDAAALAPVAQQAESCNLLVPPPGTFFGFAIISGNPYPGCSL